MGRKKKQPEEKKMETHEELKGFDIRINEFGQLVSSFSIDRLNNFLDEKVDDKKLGDDGPKRKKEEEDNLETPNLEEED